MSTTIKRVALVAVATLSLGVISVAPSTAATQADVLTLSSATASQLTGETKTAGSAVASLSFLGASTSDVMSVSAYLVSAPAGNTVSPVLAVAETTSAAIDDSVTPAATPSAVGVPVGQVANISTTGSTLAANAKLYVYLNAPTLAGTYVVKLYPAVVAGGGALNASVQTLTITVGANPALDTVVKSATIITNSGETDTATSDATVTAARGASLANAAATFKVSLLNAGALATVGESYTAAVSGPGLLGSGTVASGTIAATGRFLTVKAGDVVQLFPDGTAGVSTVTFYSVAGVNLGSKTVTFFGAPATISTSVVKTVVGPTGTPTGGVLSVSVKDAAGVNVSDLAGALGVVSDTTTVASTLYGNLTTSTYDATTGLYSVSVTGNAVGTANLKVTTNTSSADTTGITSAAVAVRVGSFIPASVKVTTDKSSYSPGEKGSVIVQLFDAAGLEVVAGESYSAIFGASGIASSYLLQNSPLPSTAVNAYTSGGKAYTFYAPITEGDVNFTWTTGTTASGVKQGLATANQGVDGSVTVSVSSVATSAAIDAANEAAAAAQDATDAAISATEAAEEASALAQEAVDSVATLSAQVSKLITALKAQITTLSNLVAKIAKKVKA